MNDGMSMDTAIDLSESGYVDNDINRTVSAKFGGDDGSYFVMGQADVLSKDRKSKFRALYVEDSKGINHHIFFKL